MLNPHTIQHFWRGAGNVKVRNGQSFQIPTGPHDLSSVKNRHHKKDGPSFSAKMLDKLQSRDSMSESMSYRAGTYEMPRKSVRYEKYDSGSDSGELRENYDELNLVFDCQTKAWRVVEQAV